jgi:nitrous oxidase accessory protein NosD
MRSRIALAVLVVGLAAVDWPIAALPHWPIAPFPPTHSGAEAQLQEVVPAHGMVITSNTRVKPGTYRLSGRDGAAAITVRGSNITVDMTGVVLEGGDPFADPDGYAGTGIEIDGGDHVTVKGATIRGYKTAILARKSPFLHLTANDLSYNWKQRLWSGIEKESLVDWMSYHNNEKDEWLRFGAAIYLSECDDAEVDHNRAVQGQNGLMITRSARLKIWNNTFSFLSSVGLGMYRTTDSMVAHNKLDYAVRGYSHGFYFRGQDSTGILMYEQSSRNVFHHNSATHGGDGLFLWAGQSTMDTGQGGANDNHFEQNDFSHAVANGIEATFSRNSFLANRIDDCWHGVWGGYSFDSLFVGNQFVGNDEAIAIEHGQNISIIANEFRDNKIGVRLWANATQDPNWGYPKNRDTRSRDILIRENGFTKGDVAIDVMRTTNLRARGNSIDGYQTVLKVGAEVPTLDVGDREGRYIVSPQHDPMPNGMNTLIPEGTARGRSTIIVDEWGPYDYRSPKVWPTGKATDRPLKLRVLGPKGTWKLMSARGGSSNAKAGVTGTEIVVTPVAGNADLRLEFEYLGEEVVDPRGRRTPAGQPHRFVYQQFEPAIAWKTQWWTWAESADPLKAPEAFAARLRETPTLSATVPRFDLISGRTLVEGLPNDRLALRADGEVRLPPGDYDLVTITDDGIRVWVGEKLVLERWDIHESIVDRVPLTGGRHRIRLEYFESTGWAELKVKIVRR